ncbi:hypothetical protein L0C16_001895 [Salmonella enterica]|nr:hypothetical protein [Salmonella enterica]EIS6616473.1 hypothetical protein [Salmonella enterica]EKF8524891.1 hypothetical protein [Salmonella enterica]
MSKRARRSKTTQGYGGMTHAQFFHNYCRNEGASEYKDLQHRLHKQKYLGNGTCKSPLTRNQRRLYKKMFGTQPVEA